MYVPTRLALAFTTNTQQEMHRVCNTRHKKILPRCDG